MLLRPLLAAPSTTSPSPPSTRSLGAMGAITPFPRFRCPPPFAVFCVESEYLLASFYRAHPRRSFDGSESMCPRKMCRASSHRSCAHCACAGEKKSLAGLPRPTRHARNPPSAVPCPGEGRCDGSSTAGRLGSTPEGSDAGSLRALGVARYLRFRGPQALSVFLSQLVMIRIWHSGFGSRGGSAHTPPPPPALPRRFAGLLVGHDS